MSYKTRLLRKSFIKEHGLDKVRIETEIMMMQKALSEIPFKCPGVVIAGKTKEGWNYYHTAYLGENSPCVWDRINFKNRSEHAYIIAVIEEESDGTGTDGYIHNAGDNRDSGFSALG